MKQYEFWFVAGTQPLYGPEVIDEVNRHASIMAQSLDANPLIPCRVVYKGTASSPDNITSFITAANSDENCAGIITWMHTFSPSKMWIAGLSRLQKPWLHFNTQFNRCIPWESIDMDFMNLNQSAHGDREHGYIGARMRINRKVIAGYWEDDETVQRIGHWMRSAVGVYESRRLKVCRFGDNMREVAVTEGDKVEAQIKLGWSVNGYGIGDLIQRVEQVTEAQIDAKMEEYKERYDIATDNIDSIRYQARLEVAVRSFLEDGGFGAFTDTFEDLQQLRQLPGLATQNLMKDGYGFGAEGDWKTAALVRIMKKMAAGLKGGTAFMEDYTYHMEKGREAILGAHMLEVDPDIAADRPRIEVHELGIGDREAPARLCFNTGDGKAIVASLIDMGDRFRMIVNDVEACAPFEDMPKLPVARVMWRPLPSLATSAEAWMLAGGAHHTVLSYQLDAEHIRDFCDMLGIEFIHIGAHTTIEGLKKELTWNDIIWKLK
jgi:L-arabinose isomerase